MTCNERLEKVFLTEYSMRTSVLVIFFLSGSSHIYTKLRQVSCYCYSAYIFSNLNKANIMSSIEDDMHCMYINDISLYISSVTLHLFVSSFLGDKNPLPKDSNSRFLYFVYSR
jgi:hypothetical protein